MSLIKFVLNKSHPYILLFWKCSTHVLYLESKIFVFKSWIHRPKPLFCNFRDNLNFKIVQNKGRSTVHQGWISWCIFHRPRCKLFTIHAPMCWNFFGLKLMKKTQNRSMSWHILQCHTFAFWKNNTEEHGLKKELGFRVIIFLWFRSFS